MSGSNNISVRSIKVADSENVTFRGELFLTGTGRLAE